MISAILCFVALYEMALEDTFYWNLRMYWDSSGSTNWLNWTPSRLGLLLPIGPFISPHSLSGIFLVVCGIYFQKQTARVHSFLMLTLLLTSVYLTGSRAAILALSIVFLIYFAQEQIFASFSVFAAATMWISTQTDILRYQEENYFEFRDFNRDWLENTYSQKWHQNRNNRCIRKHIINFTVSRYSWDANFGFYH